MRQGLPSETLLGSVEAIGVGSGRVNPAGHEQFELGIHPLVKRRIGPHLGHGR